MGNCKCSNNINPLSLISGAHFCRMWIFVEKISPKNIEIPGIPVVFRLRFTVFKTGWKNLQFESLKKSRSRKSVVHTTSRWSRDESIAWNYPPPPPSTQDAKPRQHQDYEPFFVGNPNLNLHLWRLHPGCGGETKSISWLYYFRTLFILENIIDLSRCLADSFAPPFFSWDDDVGS